MKSLIITDNQGFHHVSPKFSSSPDDSPDQTVNGIKERGDRDSDVTEEGVGDGDSASQKRTHGSLTDTVRATKKSSTPVASGTTTEKGAADKDKPTTNRNLAQGKESNAVRTATSYFDPVWNAFSKHTDGSMQWIPKQIVAIGEDFHSQVGDGKVRTTLYKVRWEGYDKKDDTWEPITHLQGYATMVKSFKESHAKDLEKLAADRQREAEKKARDDLLDAPKHTVLSMTGLTSAVWTLGMFQMVTGESCQCIQRTKQTEPCHVRVRHAACTVPNADLSSDIRTRRIWSSTISGVDLITQNSPGASSCCRGDQDFHRC